MLRSLLVILWGLALFAFVACGPEEDSSPDDDVSLKLSELKDEIREALLVNDFETVDSLSATVIGQAEEAGDHKSLIEARMFVVTSYLDRRRTREGEALLREIWDFIEDYGTPRQIIRALIQLSNFAYMDNRPDEGMELLDHAMLLVPKVDDPQVVGALYASRARARTTDNPVESIRLYYEALEKFDEAGELNNKAVVHNNIGLISHNQNDYETALEEYAKALSINLQTGNQIQTAANYNNIANALSAIGEKEAAADTLLKAVMINQKLGISPGLIQNYYNLAQVYLDTGKLDLAYSFFSQAYEESHSISFLPGIMYHSVGLADVLFRKDRYDEVPEYLEEGKRLAQQMNNLEVLASAWNIDAELNEELGNFQQALSALREQRSYVDQIDSLRREREFEEVRARLELELKTTENELLRQQLGYRERLGRNQQLILILLGLGVLVTAILLLVLYRNKSKQERVNWSLKQKNQVITAKNIQLRDLNSELKHLNDEKSRLVGMIIHDLRNPLFAVIGFLELIDESLTDPSEKEHLKMAMNSATRLNQLINSLLEVHSLEKETRQMKLEQVPVDEIVRDAIINFQEMARKKDIEIRENISMIEAYSDPAYLNRIVDNLISNAIKYSPRHSHVQVDVKIRGDRWELAVTDEGPGISKEDQSNLYQMFGRLSAKPTGGEESTGLGLYTVKMLVGRLLGRIRLESEIGKGSRFICEFPIKPDTEPEMNDVAEANLESEPVLEPVESAKF